MTDLTDESVKALLDEMTFAMFGDGTDDTISEKLARALLDARAELAQARAEAQAAVARGMERAAEILAVRADVLLVDAGADAELVRVLDASVAAIRTAATSLRTGEAG